MSETQITNALPVLPCPNCDENLLAAGFYNYCSESTALREDNHTDLVGDRLYMDHDESGHETTDHQCATDAYCSSCDNLLPWALYEIRSLDGQTLAEAASMISDFTRDANEPQEGEAAPAVA